MTITLEDGVADNYRQLVKERGLTFEQLADEFEAQGSVGHRRVAAWARQEAGVQREAKPSRRRSGPAKQTADASGAGDDDDQGDDQGDDAGKD